MYIFHSPLYYLLFKDSAHRFKDRVTDTNIGGREYINNIIYYSLSRSPIYNLLSIISRVHRYLYCWIHLSIYLIHRYIIYYALLAFTEYLYR